MLGIATLLTNLHQQIAFPHTLQAGVDRGGGGGGLMVMHGHMAVARGRVPWKLLSCVLNVCS